MIEAGKIYCEDCLDTMSRINDKTIDLIFADPPYNAKNIGPNKRVYSSGQMQLPEKLMNQQLDIFLHSVENNEESKAILDNNKVHLNKKCLQTLELLKSGIRLTVRSALLDYGISSLPRRILDLKEKGVDVKSDLINGRFKEYFL